MTYCLLDAARMDEAMEQAKELVGANCYVCLYKGTTQETLGHVAPYLFVTDADLTRWLFDEGWGKSWATLVVANTDAERLYRHFKRFLYARPEEGPPLYFRFYDPRVLRIFLPTCDADQLLTFFGSVRYFLVEDEDPTFALSFWLLDGALQSRRMTRLEAQQVYMTYLPTH